MMKRVGKLNFIVGKNHQNAVVYVLMSAFVIRGEIQNERKHLHLIMDATLYTLHRIPFIWLQIMLINEVTFF